MAQPVIGYLEVLGIALVIAAYIVVTGELLARETIRRSDEDARRGRR